MPTLTPFQEVLFMTLKGYYIDTVEKCCYFFNSEGVLKFALDYQMFFGVGSDFYRMIKKKIERHAEDMEAIADTKGERLYQKHLQFVDTKKKAS